MALSKSKLPFTAQHYLECGTENCENNCQFYCNPCHRRLCKQCRDKHQKSPDTKSHEVVPYQQRKRQLPEVTCQIHVNKDVDMLCEQCQIPVCSKCATKDHGGHTFIDLETVYAEKYAIYVDEIARIEKYFLLTSHDILKSTNSDSTEIKKIMECIRTSMRTEAESLKSMVDGVTSENIKQVNEQEKSLLQHLKSEGIKYNDYISYLNKVLKKYHGYLSSKNLQILINESTNIVKIDPVPETNKPVPPVFTASQYSKEDVTKLLGRVTVPDTKQDKESKKSDEEQTPSLSFSVTKVREYTVPGVDNVCHISLGKSGRLWCSDDKGNLVQIDPQGNQLEKINTSGTSGYTCCTGGYHTVTQDGDLIFTDTENNAIKRITQDKSINRFIKTGYWDPISIYSSCINGDILVGMVFGVDQAKVTRYNKKGKERHTLQKDKRRRALYENPHFITENINGDICISDLYKNALVVVNKSGQHRFSYTMQGQALAPYGVCTDLLGHIIVCDECSTVQILDQDGQFLSVLLTPQQGIEYPSGVCIDEDNNLIVGQRFTNSTVTIYTFLK